MRKKEKAARGGPKKSFCILENKPESPKPQASPWALAADAPAYGATFGDEAFFKANPHRRFRVRRAEPNDDRIGEAGGFHTLAKSLELARIPAGFEGVRVVLVAKHGASRFLRIAAPAFPEDGDLAADDDAEEGARMLFCGATWNNNRENTAPGLLRIIEKLGRTPAPGSMLGKRASSPLSSRRANCTGNGAGSAIKPNTRRL